MDSEEDEALRQNSPPGEWRGRATAAPVNPKKSSCPPGIDKILAPGGGGGVEDSFEPINLR